MKETRNPKPKDYLELDSTKKRLGGRRAFGFCKIDGSSILDPMGDLKEQWFLGSRSKPRSSTCKQVRV